VGLGRLRLYEVQASYALALALVSVPPFLAAAGLMASRYHADLRVIVYGAGGRFAPALLGCLLASMVPAGCGFLLGWSSAGQRRNDKPARSWLGFFVGGGVLTLDLILVIAFFMLRMEQS